VRTFSNLIVVTVSLIFAVGCAALAPQQPPAPVSVHPQPPLASSSSRTSSDRFTLVTVETGDSFGSLAKKHLKDPSLGWTIAEANGGVLPEVGGSLVIPLVPLFRGGLSTKGYQTVPILCYHKFSKFKGDLMTVPERAFEEQMRFLKEAGYHVLTMDQFFDFLDFKGQIPGKSVVITIDDGWRSAYDIAFPILKRYGYAATLFVYTDFVGGGSKAMDWDAVREMAKNGIDIQCHTKTHRALSKAENEGFREYFEAIQRELTESARVIKTRAGTDVKYLAYPYRDTNNIVVALLEKLGYRGAFTVTRGSDPFFVHPYRIGRSMIYGTFDLDDFKSNLTVFDNELMK
jgi:peptidoglycan/xylan/chitin deacetylase (PgdA/CDA1 family)